MKFLDLKNELIKLNLIIFTLNDIIKITNQNKNTIKTKLSLLTKQNKIFRLKKGIYSLKEIENKFELQIAFNETYIGLNSALEFYESSTQRFNNLNLISKQILHNQEINKTKITFTKINENLFFGFEKQTINNTEIFISNKEKTIIDCCYFSNKVYLSEINKFIQKFKNELNIERIENYLNKIDSTTLNKRTGFLFELNNIELNNIRITNKYEKLNKNLQKKGRKNNKWKIIINENLNEIE